MRERVWEKKYGSYPSFYKEVYGQHISASYAFGSWATIFEVAQSAGDWSDAPTPDLVVAWLPSASVGFTYDLGSGRFQGDHRTGEVITIAPDAGTSIQVNGPHLCRVMSVPYEPLKRTCDPEGELLPTDGDFGPLHNQLLRSPELQKLLNGAWREASAGGPRSRLFADGLILQIVGWLSSSRSIRQRRTSQGGLAPWQERRATEYLRDHLAVDLTLTALAADAGLSAFHFARQFKRSTGLPPHAYQRRLRRDRARELLVSTELSVGEIAAAVGYETPQAFARMFRAEVGATPSEYRRQQR